ncbi:beta propeller repeat protein [Oceanobacter kriegii]|uniref:hypothetical protein n=1 Tax=Oceanobacter kriegii TaxID=64972 RepID=UPI000423BF9F|nr:hypothetical protein [Oceanobacter kriegii]
MSDKEYEIEHVIDAARSTDGRYSLYTMYDESDPLSAVGQLAFCSDNTHDQLLGVNCQLNAFWISPSGSVWVVDDHGDVYTTASASFSGKHYKNLEFSGNGFEWNVKQIFWGQLNGVWGTSDNDVWVTSFNGEVLHWNGAEWKEEFLFESPNSIDGSGLDDVYVVGYSGNIFHWNGAKWSKVILPDDVGDDEAFTDVCVVDSKTVYITGRNSRLLKGNAIDGFCDIGVAGYSWYGVGNIDNRVFLAGGAKGIFEYADGKFVCLKDKGNPVGVFSSGGSVFFIPAEQQPRAWYVEYNPTHPKPWSRYNTI